MADKIGGVDFCVQSLGECTIPSPVCFSTQYGDSIANYVPDSSRIIMDVDMTDKDIERVQVADLGLVEHAGPREWIYFNPHHVRAAIVTCGGLCPGLNDVIRGLVRGLWRYGARHIFGIRYGYHGLLPESTDPLWSLNPDVVDVIHHSGGSVLGSSRGGGDRTSEIVDTLGRLNLNVLFVIGGDGTQKGALAIAQEVRRRGLKISVVGIPKTIDNDISFVQRSFGFETAVAKATEAVWSAKAESSSAQGGVGLVKVMGRDSGFVATHTAIASHVVDIVLIPEVPFLMEGEYGFLNVLHNRLKTNGEAVVVIAEGAGQELLTQEQNKTDASGNRVLGDIGLYLQGQIKSMFTERGIAGTIKYINPSYIIRSATATPSDSLYCSRLATNAVHAAMAGKTQALITMLNNRFVHLPIELVISKRNRVNPESSLWRDAVESTGQPLIMNGDQPECGSG